MIVLLADHPTVAALPVLAPALLIGLAVLVHYLRERRHWED